MHPLFKFSQTCKNNRPFGFTVLQTMIVTFAKMVKVNAQSNVTFYFIQEKGSNNFVGAS